VQRASRSRLIKSFCDILEASDSYLQVAWCRLVGVHGHVPVT
jgi:hypothetical protein